MVPLAMKCIVTDLYLASTMTIRAELLKTHLKPDNTAKSMADVVMEGKALESAHVANKLLSDSTKSTTEEQVHLGQTQGNEAMQKTWHLSLVWGPEGTSSLKAMSGRRENMLYVRHQ